MFFDPIDIPDELIEAQEQGKLVIFAGAGVSMGKPSNLPSFKGLAANIAGSHPLSVEIDKYDARLDRFLGELTRLKVDVQKLCRHEIGDLKSKPTELHHSLVALFPRLEHVRIVTTNFDDHFRIALKRRGWKTDCYCAPALPLGYQFSGLVYLHGWIQRPEPFVLTDEDFGRAYITEGWARDFLQRLFTEFTTLFVGYSHNDLPVEYLARGMSGKAIAPRFALTAAGEDGLWASLGIRKITFEKSKGSNQFKNLYAGVKRWAEFTQQQPTDIAERVKDILNIPDNVVPDKSQSSLLKRCLEREDSYHFFTNEAKGWRWVEWLSEQGMLGVLFDDSQQKQPETNVRGLADWLAAQLLNEESDKGLLLVDRHGGALGQLLWAALRYELCLNPKVDWNSLHAQKWLFILADSRLSDRSGGLLNLLETVLKKGPCTLGMALFRRLIELRVVMRKGFEFDSFRKGENSAIFKDTAEVEIKLAGAFYEFDTIWSDWFKPRFSEFRESLLSLLVCRLQESHELGLSIGQSSATNDSFCVRGRINEREIYQNEAGLNGILDLLLNVIGECRNRLGTIPEHRLTEWLSSGVPVIVRVGLYALSLSIEISEARKVELVRNLNLIFPPFFGAKHEAWLVLTSCYARLLQTEKQCLWIAIKQGRPRNGPDEETQKSSQDEIDDLTWFLATKNKGCSESDQAFAELMKRKPDFQGYQGMDQVFFKGPESTDEPRRSKAFTGILSSPPAVIVQEFLNFRDDDPFHESARLFSNAIEEACTQNDTWGALMMEELAKLQAWKCELWTIGFWRVSPLAFRETELSRLLHLVLEHFVEFQSLRSVTAFFSKMRYSEEKQPSPDNLGLMIQVSLSIWKHLKTIEPAENHFRDKDWFSSSCYHSAGPIVRFWLNCCELQQQNRIYVKQRLPEWLQEPLADIVAGADNPSQLGRAMLSRHLRFVYDFDCEWTKTQLLPKFQFLLVGEAAFLVWQPFLSHGELSRGLMLQMRPIYKEAFPFFRNVNERLKTGFFYHVASIAISRVVDVNEDKWFAEFFLDLNDEEKANWVGRLRAGLIRVSDKRIAFLWERWIKAFWADRLCGRPCPLGFKEAEEMFYMIFVVGDAFPEAVEFVIRGPRIQPVLNVVLSDLKAHEACEKYPEAVLRLLNWLLEPLENHWCKLSDIAQVLFLLPKKKAFLPALNSICQHLTLLAYSGAVELKSKIESTFVEV